MNEALANTEWHLCHAANVSAALNFLRSNPLAVAICDCDLESGDCREMLNALHSLPDPPKLIVGSHSPDNTLWAEVLNLGAYDLLMRPYNPQEVAAVLASAGRAWLSYERPFRGVNR